MTSSIQNSTFCTDKEGNKKEVRNNNEQPVGTDGDTNANEITSQTYITEEKEKKHNLTAGILNEHLHLPQNVMLPNEALDDPVKQDGESRSAEVGNQSHRSRNLEFSVLHKIDKIETVELEKTEYTQHHEKACSLQCPDKQNQKFGTGKIVNVPQIQKEWYSLKRHTYVAEAAKEHQWPRIDATDENEKMHFIQLSCKDSSSSNSLEKVNKKDISVEIGESREDGTGCCTGPLNFQEFCMDATGSTHNSQRASEDLIKAISPSDPSDCTSVETIVFHSNSSTSEIKESAPELQTKIERPLDLVNVSTSHCENVIYSLGPGGELLVAINKPEAQVNLDALPNQCGVIDAHNRPSTNDQQETGEFLSELTRVQSRRNIFGVKEEIEPCNISQQSSTRLPEDIAKTVQHLPDSTKEQHLKNLNVEDQFLDRQVENYAGDSPVSENNSSLLMRQCCKNKTFSLIHTEFGTQHSIETAELLGSSFSNATNNVANVKSTISRVPNTTQEAVNYTESDKVPCTRADELSKQECDGLHDVFEITGGRKGDARQSLVSDSSSLEHEAVQAKSISKTAEKEGAEALSIPHSELLKQHLSKQDANTGKDVLQGPRVSLGQYVDESPVEKEASEINSNVMIIGEKQLTRVSEKLQHSENLLVSQTVNPAFIACTEVDMKVTNQSSDSAFKETSLLRAGILSESLLLPPLGDMQTSNSFFKASDKAVCNSGIPKPILQHPKTVLTDKGETETNYQSKPEGKAEAKLIPKTKYVRPKIITYIRKPLQVKPLDAIHDALGLSPKLSTWTESISKPCISKEYKSATCENKPLSVLSVPGSIHDRYRPELPRTKIYTTGLMVSGIKPPAQQTFPRMMGKPFPPSSDVTSKKATDMFTQESIPKTETLAPGRIGSEQNVASVPEESSSPAPYTAVSRLPKTLRPPLGLGAISRLPAAKSRLAFQSQRTSINSTALQIQGQVGQEIAVVTVPSLLKDLALYWVEQKKNTIPIVQRSNLPKPGHSGLRPPGYSRLPAAKLMAFGFVRSSSVSSVSSNQSNDSVHSDHSKAANRSNSGSDEKISLKAGASVNDVSKRAGKIGLQPPSSTATNCWSLLPTPKSTVAGTMKKEVQKDHDISKPVTSSPKRHVTPASKLHSPGLSKLRSAAGVARNGFSAKPDLQSRETERQTVQRLKDKCKKQAKQLQSLHEHLKRASLSIEVLAVTTQHFHHKNESVLIKEKELSIELAHIREEVALNTTRCEKLQKEKEELERRFEIEVQRLHLQQQEEIQALEERLKAHYTAEKERLIQEHREHLKKIDSEHKDQLEEMSTAHTSTITEVENNHTVTITILQDEHEKKLEELKAIHEFERMTLEDNFEKLRLSLQDQVDTLTFQNRSLKDKAKRFEEALRRSTDEQLEIALAPYQHLEEDMNSLKHVLEMKNQQIHHQEKKIMDLEKLAEKNVVLEEKVQVLQQQNEDLKARIDNNVALTRQLSEENATLHEYVEKESKEKKRLSRTNEELVWRLQTGEPVSPVKISSSSSNFQSSQGTLVPSAVSANPR
ncbi:microtubule-associated tumor suppressor candidate 2-like [Carcharodon carcharias]|uniref:microtubule-associated tumor suppressor candidate 2-like n=1 Tax=Carcharodon carcharias TaxID=13397 RepID=UPI001B7EA6AE|nr:microtubule-associated tumor suppressor candidate 2-like [Carcharodon carcharias]